MRQSLTRAELAGQRPIPGEGGRSVRAFCPFHGGDNQRSLRVDNASGRFQCFACGVWGYLDGYRFGSGTAVPRPKPEKPSFEDRGALLAEYQRQLPWAREYLEQERGIPYELAKRYGLGFAHRGRWAHPSRDCAGGRVVVPHATPDGAVVNLYGRAMSNTVSKDFRHDHLPGPKGYFHAEALREGTGPLYICEGPFDALSLLAAGKERVLAIFGVRGWRWEWVPREVREIVLALDADAAGSTAWRELGRQARMRGIRVSVIETYGDGCKDANEAWLAGQLAV